MYTPSGIVKVPAADRSYRTMATCSASSLEDRIRDLVTKKRKTQTNNKQTQKNCLRPLPVYSKQEKENQGEGSGYKGSCGALLLSKRSFSYIAG